MTERNNCLSVKKVIELLDENLNNKITNTDGGEDCEFPIYSKLKNEIKIQIDDLADKNILESV